MSSAASENPMSPHAPIGIRGRNGFRSRSRIFIAKTLLERSGASVVTSQGGRRNGRPHDHAWDG